MQTTSTGEENDAGGVSFHGLGTTGVLDLGKVIISAFCPAPAPYHQRVTLQLPLYCSYETLTILTSIDFEELGQNACMTDNKP